MSRVETMARLFAQNDADILATVRAYGPTTAEEIAERAGYARPGVNMRLARMLAAGVLRRTRAQRKAGARGQVAFLWEVAA